MGNTYTRQSTNEIATGLVINAADLNAEFNALLDAFSSSDGHSHDGTANEGGRIAVFGQAGELRGTNANIIQPFQDDIVDLGTTSARFKDFYLSGIAYLDAINLNDIAITSTGTELNIVDGNTSATSTTLANADRLIVNDNGTMVQVALTDFETYFESELDTLSNVTTVGALSTGSIASGFGAITTTNTITFGTLSDSTTNIAGFKDEDDMSSDSNTHLPTQQSVKAYVDAKLTASDLDFQADSGGALSIDLDSETLTFTGGTGIDTSGSGNAVTFAIDSTVTTLAGSQTLTNKTLTTPIIEEIDSSGTITLDAGTDITLDADGGDVFLKDGGTTYGSLTNNSSNLIIKSGTTTALTFAGANATFAGTLAVGNLLLNTNSLTSTDTNGNISITPNGDGKIILDGLSFPIADGSANQVLKTDGGGQLSFTNINTDLSADSSPQLGANLDLNNQDITGTGNINISGNATFSGNLTVNGTTTTVNTTNTVVSDSLIELANGTTGTPANDAGIVIERGNENNAFIGFDEGTDKFTVGTGTFTGASTGALSITTGTLIANIEGNVTGNVTGTIQNGSSGQAYTFPSSDGTDGQFLKTDGSGALSFGGVADNSIGADELDVTGDGTSGQALLSDGDGTMTWGTIAFYPQTITVLTTGTSYTIPSNARAILIKASGGGGGGARRVFSPNQSYSGTDGTDTTVTCANLSIAITAKHGRAGILSGGGLQPINTTDVGGDFVHRGGGAIGGFADNDNWDVAAFDGKPANLVVKYVTGDLGGEVLTFSIGAGGAGGSTAEDGQDGYLELWIW